MHQIDVVVANLFLYVVFLLGCGCSAGVVVGGSIRCYLFYDFVDGIAPQHQMLY
jgi:hypothetical protein